MAEATEPTTSISSVRSSPKDIQLMASILKEMGVNDFEPRVLSQMLEFSFRYLTTILDDAYLYSTHAKKKYVDSEDVKLAVSLHQERLMAAPPARDVILEIAKQRNSMPLPQIKSTAGLHLPPDRHSLTSCNYRLKSASKKRVHTVSRFNVVPSNLVNKTAALANVNKTPSSVLTKGNTNLSPAITKPVVSISKPLSSPIIKISDGKGITTSSPSPTPPAVTTAINTAPQILIPTEVSNPTTTTQILVPTIEGTSTSGTELPRPSISIATSSQLMLLPTTSAPQINMPTVGSMHSEIELPNEAKGEDDDYDMID